VLPEVTRESDRCGEEKQKVTGWRGRLCDLGSDRLDPLGWLLWPSIGRTSPPPDARSKATKAGRASPWRRRMALTRRGKASQRSWRRSSDFSDWRIAHLSFAW